MRRLNGIADSMDMGLSELWEIMRKRQGWHAAVLSPWSRTEPYTA